MADKVIEPQIGVGGVAVLGIDVAHVGGGQARIELAGVVIGFKGQSRAVVAPDDGVGVVLVRIEVYAITNVRVPVILDLVVRNPHGVPDLHGIVFFPDGRGARTANGLIFFASIIGAIVLRLEFNGTGGLVLIGIGDIVQFDLQKNRTLKSTAKSGIAFQRDLLDQLAVGVFVNVKFPVVAISQVFPRNCVADFLGHFTKRYIESGSRARRVN